MANTNYMTSLFLAHHVYDCASNLWLGVDKQGKIWSAPETPDDEWKPWNENPIELALAGRTRELQLVQHLEQRWEKDRQKFEGGGFKRGSSKGSQLGQDQGRQDMEEGYAG